MQYMHMRFATTMTMADVQNDKRDKPNPDSAHVPNFGAQASCDDGIAHSAALCKCNAARSIETQLQCGLSCNQTQV
jgi:hypothetical protein